MNEKKARRLRAAAKRSAERNGLPQETAYEIHRQLVEIDDAYWLRTHYMSKAATIAFDSKYAERKARKYGVMIDFVLSGIYGPVAFTQDTVKLGQCTRRVYQRAKRVITKRSKLRG